MTDEHGGGGAGGGCDAEQEALGTALPLHQARSLAGVAGAPGVVVEVHSARLGLQVGLVSTTCLDHAC